MSSGTLESFFLEHRLLTELSNGQDGLLPTRSERDAGWCADLLQRGEASHLWAPLLPGVPAPQPLPAEAWTAFGPHRAPDALGAPELEPLRELTRALEAAVVRAGGEALEVFIQDAQQRVLCGPAESWAEAHRRHTVLEARVSVKSEGRPASLWRPFGFGEPAALLAEAARVEASCVELVQALRDGLPVVPCPDGELPVVFPPGAASGSFFHEVCGHPLEGDVVARRGSYLALRLGQRVAEEFVTVRDDPTEARGSLSYAFDDEGTPARGATLLDRGVVSQPMLSRRTAEVLGLASNGHGRRVGFRYYPLPRMTHTGVDAGPHGTLAELLAPVERGLFVQHLVPRHMNLLSGDFSFVIVEAREIRDGRLGPLVGPGVLSGDGLQALRDLEAVGGDRRNLFATRGCRKLDHGPLAVSFSQPSLRFKKLRVAPSR